MMKEMNRKEPLFGGEGEVWILEEVEHRRVAVIDCDFLGVVKYELQV